MTRSPLELAIRDPGFTPSVRDVVALVQLLADDDLVRDAERAIGRADRLALGPLSECFRAASPPLRARVLRAIGRFASDATALAVLIAALDDADPKTRRNAAIALGHVRVDGVEVALLRAWDRDERPEMHRSIAASLGKVGTQASLAVLRKAAVGDDAELSRIAERAAIMIERTESRNARGRLDAERVPDGPVAIEVLARRGIEGILAEELSFARGVVDVRVAGPGRVRARMVGAMNSLFVARTMLSFRFPLPSEWLDTGDTTEEATARAIASDEARRVVSTFTVGAARYRIAWTEQGHKRALAWSTARAISRRAPDLVNDATASLWELAVTAGPRFGVALVPRDLVDPRFAWRRRDVPAASHPTIAAALVRVAGVRDDDVVWDPFVGSGAELAERARAGAYQSLLGSDLDARALAAARENLDAAGARALLEQEDAVSHSPRGVSVIVTNPPMGRRASRIPNLMDLLDRFVEHAAGVLVPGGRFVWLSPAPKRARAAAARVGLTLDWSQIVDMGGFDAEMQRWLKTG